MIWVLEMFQDKEGKISEIRMAIMEAYTKLMHFLENRHLLRHELF